MFPRSRLFWSVSIGHLTVDMFNSAVPVILAFLSGHLLHMTNTQIGFAVGAYQMIGAISQPLCGWLADRSGGRWLGAGGVAWTVLLLVVSLVVAAATRSYTLMLIPLLLGALGSGAFHPTGTMHSADNDPQHRTMHMSVFFFMGSVGGGLGPAIAGILLDRAASNNHIFTSALGPTLSGRLAEQGSITPLLFFALVAIPSVLLMWLFIPGARAHRERQSAELAAAPDTPRRKVIIAPLLLLMVIVTLRGLINPGLVAFMPALFQSRGWSASEYGLVTSMYWIGGGVMGIVFGQLADRYGSRLLIVASMLLAAPAVFGLSVATGPFAFVLALLVGAFGGGAHSLIVAMAQNFMPAGKGLASGTSLGFIFGTGALGVVFIGAVADRIGLEAAFQLVAVVGVVTGLLSLFLPADRPQKQPAVTPVEEVVAA